MSDIVTDTAAAIKDMRIRGAGRIARAGATAMGGFAASYKGTSLEGFTEDLNKAKDTILASRPTAVSLWNGVNACIKDVPDAKDLASARESVSANAAAFVESSSKAVETIAAIGAKRIRDGDVIMTHCNSSAVVAVLK